MKRQRIKMTLMNRTKKEMDLSDFRVIPEDIFSNRREIEKIELPDGVKVIGNNAFENCLNLKEIVFPKSLERIESEAFLNCVNLKKVVFRDGAQVDRTAFSGCQNLSEKTVV